MDDVTVPEARESGPVAMGDGQSTLGRLRAKGEPRNRQQRRAQKSHDRKKRKGKRRRG